LPWYSDPVGGALEEGHVRWRAFQHGNETEQRDGMDVANPIVLRSGERSRRRRRDALQYVLAAIAEGREIVEHPFVVTGLFRNVLAQVLQHARGDRIGVEHLFAALGGRLHQRNTAANDRVIAEEELGIDLAQPGMTPQLFGDGIQRSAHQANLGAQTAAVAEVVHRRI